MSTERNPSDQVDVALDFGEPLYPNLVASLYGSDPDAVAWWVDLGDLLGGRPGWRCDLTPEGLSWHLGPVGTSLFNVTAPDDAADYGAGRYRIYDHGVDDEVELDGTSSTLSWLEQNESRHNDHLAALRPLVSSMDWAVLTARPFDVYVSHDDLTFIATVPRVTPFEAAFAPDVVQVLAAARSMIAVAFGAPAEVGDRLDLRANFDEKATRALSAPVGE